MDLLVRSWNVFHGRTDPPGRRGYLREMVALATADRPDVLCLQEVPVWALLRLADWSGGMTVVPAITRLPVWPAPLTAWLTRSHEAFFRSALAGQANAILVRLRARRRGSRERADQHRRPRGEARLGGPPALDRRSPTSTPATTSRTPRSRAPRSVGPASSPRDTRARASPSCSQATSTSATPGSTATARQGRGSTTSSFVATSATRLETWPRARRLQNGAVLSDHAPVELRVVSEDAS